MRIFYAQRKDNKINGMSLIEILIVIVIIGTLSAIAIPSYQKQLHQAQRYQAQADLFKLQLWLEHKFTLNAEYPDQLNCPECDLSEHYDFNFELDDETLDYQIIATPKANSEQVSDECYAQILDKQLIQSSQDSEGNAILTKKCWQ